MNEKWKFARKFVENLRDQLYAIPADELLQLPENSLADVPSSVPGFTVSVEHVVMVNGTTLTTVEAKNLTFLGLFRGRVFASLEVSPKGEKVKNPTYLHRESVFARSLPERL